MALALNIPELEREREGSTRSREQLLRNRWDPESTVTLQDSSASELWMAPLLARETQQAEKAFVLRALDELRQLPPNWNGYGAVPIDQAVIEAAKQFIQSLPRINAPSPHVVPMTRGRLQLEWDRGNRSLELEFENPSTIHYLKWDSDAGVEEENTLMVTQTAELQDLLSWFASE